MLYLLIHCAASRAVHLELTTNLLGESCIRALDEVFHVYSFATMRKRTFLLRNDIDIKFILSVSPWLGGVGWGGCYERLVRSVKMSLKKLLGKAKLTYEEETALIEVEGVINCRPLNPVYDDELLEPLTPSHLFAGRNIGVKLGKLLVHKESNSKY